MKACVSTYCTWQSYGSMLQAVGLNRALESLDCNSYIAKLSEDSSNPADSPVSIKQTIKKAADYFNKKNREVVRQKGESFIRRHLDVREYPDYQGLCADPPTADVYIAGSDQIWHPGLMNPVFFLDFVKNVKKISYAASMGRSVISEESATLFRKYLSDFDTISVREAECAEAVEKLTENPISVNIDPVFLLSADEWRDLEEKYPVKEPYILLYTIFRNDGIRGEVKRLRKRLGIPVYTIKSGFTKDYADKPLYDVGPAEFLWLIDNAEYVVTSSFHGTAFSTIFNKRFSTIVNPSEPSRINSLKKVLEIQNVGLNDMGKESLDYNRINERIEFERDRGLSYLRNSL